jgi:hypothetical protein
MLRQVLIGCDCDSDVTVKKVQGQTNEEAAERAIAKEKPCRKCGVRWAMIGNIIIDKVQDSVLSN